METGRRNRLGAGVPATRTPWRGSFTSRRWAIIADRTSRISSGGSTNRDNPHSFRDTVAWIVNTDLLIYWTLVDLARFLVDAKVFEDEGV